MGKMKGAIAGWKEKRREKKIRKQEEKEGRTGSRSSSPSLSPEREGGYVAPVTTATTGPVLTHPDTTHTLPTYQTAATGVPIRDTTKDYVRNLGMEVPVGTADPLFAKKHKKHTGSWDYADQRIQKIETHFPQGVQTERVLLTQQVPVIVEQVQPVIVAQQVPVTETVTTTITEQIPFQQQQQFTELTTTQIQNLTSQGLTEIPTTQLAHLQINTELPIGTTFTPANQLSENIAVNMPYESNLQAANFRQNLQQANFQQQNLQQANFQYEQSTALQPGMLGDLTSTGALRTIQETGLSNQGSFGNMVSGSSQPLVQETITRTVEKEIINNPQTFQAPKY